MKCSCRSFNQVAVRLQLQQRLSVNHLFFFKKKYGSVHHFHQVACYQQLVAWLSHGVQLTCSQTSGCPSAAPPHTSCNTCHPTDQSHQMVADDACAHECVMVRARVCAWVEGCCCGGGSFGGLPASVRRRKPVQHSTARSSHPLQGYNATGIAHELQCERHDKS